jgi:hypothetical protein
VIAGRLLALAFPAERAPAAAELRNERDWLRALASTPPQVAISGPGVGLVLGAAAAAVTVAELLGGRRATVERELRGRGMSAPRSGWAGYLSVQDGWVSIAIGGADELELVGRCLDVHGGKRPVEIATALQEWGVASFPLSPSTPATTAIPRATPTPLDQLLRETGFQGADGLTGVRVIDCGQLVSAPWASALLTAWGAEVVSVCHPDRAGARRYGAPAIGLDLGVRDDRRRFARLCRRADLVLDNFRDRVWTNLDLDPLELGARLHMRLPAFPQDDPRRGLKAFGFQLEALFGIGHVPVPEPGQRAVDAPREALLDHSIGFAAAARCAAALLRGDRGRLELSHLDLIEAAS